MDVFIVKLLVIIECNVAERGSIMAKTYSYNIDMAI